MMRYEISLSPEAVEDLKRVPAAKRVAVRAVIERHLRHEPTRTSRSRIKRLRGLDKPQYRLRIGDYRLFYDVSETAVEILAIMAKSETEAWLAQFGPQS